MIYSTTYTLLKIVYVSHHAEDSYRQCLFRHPAFAKFPNSIGIGLVGDGKIKRFLNQFLQFRELLLFFEVQTEQLEDTIDDDKPEPLLIDIIMGDAVCDDHGKSH